MRATYSHFWRIGAIRLGASALLCAVLGNTVSAQIVYPAPPLVIQDVQWTSGTHHYSQSPAIVAPDDPGHPVEVSGTADAEFVSGTAVHLTDGFQAGSFTGDGQFRARIGDQYGDPESIVLIPSEPGAQIVDGVVHVPKWEKLEIGIELPPAYQAAVDSFFAHYYSNGPDALATSGNVNDDHDLNPYADDSLQVFMKLTKPNGEQTLKWGFFMREAKWANDTAELAMLIENTSSPRSRYNIRFRYAPDTVGEWGLEVLLRAPHTTSTSGEHLPDVSYNALGFTCTTPLPDNKGDLRVNPVNQRMLQFDTRDPFFGIGPNFADMDGGPTRAQLDQAGIEGDHYFKVNHDLLMESMGQLHEVGGNFARIWLTKYMFQPEFRNLGVYDSYLTVGCDARILKGNCQYQCYAFDKVLEQARATNIYIQLCVDAQSYPTTAGFQKEDWGHNPLWLNFIQPFPGVAGNIKDIKRYFYSLDSNGVAERERGSFYYWKRKYKYIMSRWGYSANLPIIEPFNETDQMLSYFDVDSIRGNCSNFPDHWFEDPDLPATIDSWLTDLTSFLRDSVDLSNPATSPLGEKKLFTMSYAWNDAFKSDRDTFYLPFNNPNIDIMDAHWYGFPGLEHVGQPDGFIRDMAASAMDFHREFPTTGDDQKKPINHGEVSHTTNLPGFDGIEGIFHNYEVSFHNEIWAGAFSGKFATGLTWLWSRVFWWKNSWRLPTTTIDLNNDYQQFGFSNEIGDTNRLDIGTEVLMINRRIHHHYKPLADLLGHPSWQPYGFLSGQFTAERVFDTVPADGLNALEAYYLKDSSGTLAIGWVHNRNAWVMNSYYLYSTLQNFLGCTAPDSTRITLGGFSSNTPLYITWFSTRMDSTAHPPALVDTTSATGTLTLDLTGYLGGTANDYLDTLRSDYAFIITPTFFEKRLPPRPFLDQPLAESEWDFTLYPNPGHDVIYLRFSDDLPKSISLLDIAGRQVMTRSGINAPTFNLYTAHLAMGPYWVLVSDGERRKVKKLIIN